jgi:hypothetical protein
VTGRVVERAWSLQAWSPHPFVQSNQL